MREVNVQTVSSGRTTPPPNTSAFIMVAAPECAFDPTPSANGELPGWMVFQGNDEHDENREPT